MFGGGSVYFLRQSIIPSQVKEQQSVAGMGLNITAEVKNKRIKQKVVMLFLAKLLFSCHL